MRVSIPSLSILVSAATASYVLEDDYSSSSFAGMFDFFTVSVWLLLGGALSNAVRTMTLLMATSTMSPETKQKAQAYTRSKTALSIWVLILQTQPRAEAGIVFGSPARKHTIMAS